MRPIFSTWKRVFSKPKYLILSIIIAVLFYSINVLISSLRNLKTFYLNSGFLKTLNYFSAFFLGFKDTILFSSFITIIIISILFGIFLSLIIYKVNLGIGGKPGFFGWFGAFLAAFVPGCLACGVGLFALLGLSSAFLAFLPYKGVEISIIAILLLSFSIIKISNDRKVCNA